MGGRTYVCSYLCVCVSVCACLCRERLVEVRPHYTVGGDQVHGGGGAQPAVATNTPNNQTQLTGSVN